MTQHGSIRGVLAPVVTPFGPDMSLDGDRLLAQCRWLLSNDVGLAVFGTTSEGNSLSAGEKLQLLERLAAGGLDTARMMPGTGTCSFVDSVALCKQAVAMGCGGVLMLPPFYYKNPSDEGLFRFFAEVIERVADDRLRVYLYHIPPVAQVGITPELIERLLAAYPGIVCGMKDSGGDWSYTEAVLRRFEGRGFDVFSGSEAILLSTLRLNGAGCISATANVNPRGIVEIYANRHSGNADLVQEKANRVRAVIQKYPMIPALKALLAHGRRDPELRRVRPPLVELSAEAERSLLDDLDSVGFSLAAS